MAKPKPPKQPEKLNGRPTKCTPELVKQICDLIREAHYVVFACLQVGIEEKTYYNWRERGKSGEEPYASFLQSIKIAEANAQVLLMSEVKSMAREKNKCWSAFMTIMARRWPQLWGENRVDVREVKQKQAKLEAAFESMKSQHESPSATTV